MAKRLKDYELIRTATQMEVGIRPWKGKLWRARDLQTTKEIMKRLERSNFSDFRVTKLLSTPANFSTD